MKVTARAKITQIGDSIGLILPREAAARLKVKKGDSVFLTETPAGYVIIPYDPEFEAQMKGKIVLGRKIQLKIEDGACVPDRSRAAAEKLITQDIV
jgi:putative addiction module antidote